MKNNYYQIYIDSIIQLASSIVIKSDDTAITLNKQLTDKYGDQAVDPNNSRTWRYYLNVSGQYHSEDTVMTVVSLDTLETITFSKDSLQIHTGTAAAYQYGTRNYKELISRYPDQERLILGILYPCDIGYAVESLPGTILSYPPNLIEEHEYSLMSKIQNWIYDYLGRWDNIQFKLSDNLYTATMLGNLFLSLIPAIVNFRLKACKTNEVHSYHLKQYLASHGMLDGYIPYMSRKQQLFLYRNIAYIARNNGKNAIFHWLMDNLLTDRGIPLAEYKMKHDLTEQPEQLRPIVKFRKNPLNTRNNFDSKNLFTLEEVLNKEDNLARDNIKYRDEYEPKIIKAMQNSLSSNLKTKLVESTMIDYAGSEHYTLADTLLNQWFHLSGTGLYRTFIPIEMPSTAEVLTIRANRALELFIYAYYKTIGIELTHLPKIITKRVLRLPRPNVADLMSIVDNKRVSSEFAQRLLSTLPPNEQYVTTLAFRKWCVELHKAALRQYYMVVAEEKSEARGQKLAMMSRCWSNSVVQLGTSGQTYTQWFSQQNIDISNYSNGDLENLYKEILKKAIGGSLEDEIGLRQIQAAMIKLMGQLGSYSTQYSVIVNATPIMDVPCSVLRLDNFEQTMDQENKIVNVLDVENTKTTINNRQTFELGSKEFDMNVGMRINKSINYELTSEPLVSDSLTSYIYRQNLSIDVRSINPSIDTGSIQIEAVPGVDLYLGMADQNKSMLKDIWNY